MIRLEEGIPTENCGTDEGMICSDPVDFMSTIFNKYLSGGDLAEKQRLFAIMRRVKGIDPDKTDVTLAELMEHDRELFYTGSISTAEYIDTIQLSLELGHQSTVGHPLTLVLKHIDKVYIGDHRRLSLKQYQAGIMAIIDYAKIHEFNGLASRLRTQHLNIVDSLLVQYAGNDNSPENT